MVGLGTGVMPMCSRICGSLEATLGGGEGEDTSDLSPRLWSGV